MTIAKCGKVAPKHIGHEEVITSVKEGDLVEAMYKASYNHKTKCITTLLGKELKEINMTIITLKALQIKRYLIYKNNWGAKKNGPDFDLKVWCRWLMLNYSFTLMPKKMICTMKWYTLMPVIPDAMGMGILGLLSRHEMSLIICSYRHFH